MTVAAKITPLEVLQDPQPPCELCGCAIEDLEELIYLRAADLIAQWERADSRDRWRHTGEPPPPAHVRNSDISAWPADKPRPYRPAESTISEFWYIATREPEKLKAWLARHHDDAPALRQIWKAKRCSQ
jgi:hypothetical protein